MSAAATLDTDTSSPVMCQCNYGTGDDIKQVQVPKDVLQLFRLFRDVNEDCPAEDGSFYADIPIIKDAKGAKILFNEAELNLFFELTAIAKQLTIQQIETYAINQDLLKRFLLLINFLDYEVYLHTLCNYTAFLIKECKFILN